MQTESIIREYLYNKIMKSEQDIHVFFENFTYRRMDEIDHLEAVICLSRHRAIVEMSLQLHGLLNRKL